MANVNNNISWPGWETVRLIGRGSFGAVYEIQREIRGRTEHAALKVISIPQHENETRELRADGYDDESITQYYADGLEKIETEYAMMADLKGHSNVVYCDDIRKVQHDDGFGWDVYIKMELLTPMKTALADTVTDAEVIKIGEDICNALTLCDKLNIVHRDIKPENIFVSRNGSFKLGDFGIAKTMEGTTGGTKTGTYDYMSPEVYNNRPYHTQADIYSLGIVMYWLLNDRTTPLLPQNGKRPTPSSKESARERRFSGEKIPKPKNGSEELKRIVLKACAFDPRERYQSALEMLEDLTHLTGGKLPAFELQPVQNPELVTGSGETGDVTAGVRFNRGITTSVEARDDTVGPTFAHYATTDVDDSDKTVGPQFSAEGGKESKRILQGRTETKSTAKIKARKAKRKEKIVLCIGIPILILTIAFLVSLASNNQKDKEQASMRENELPTEVEELVEETRQVTYSVVIDTIEIEVGQETNVAFLVNEYTYRSDEELIWESSNPLVASVTDNGRVTGVSEGKATITGSFNGLASSVSITVLPISDTIPETIVNQPPAQINNIQVECTTDVLLIGDTVDASASSDSWYFYGDSEGLIWSIDDTSTATVDSKGRVTGKRPGKCQLRVEYQGFSSTMEITVVEVDRKSTVTAEVDYGRLSMRAGSSDTIALTVSGELPENCSVMAYYSTGLQLWLKWGETRNPLELTITLEHYTEPEGYITILIYDEENPTRIVAAEKVYIRMN